MAINIRFSCGHEGVISDSVSMSPVCHCGETQITYVKPSRPPRFTGSVTGPYAQFSHAEPAVVNVAPAGPLVIKESA